MKSIISITITLFFINQLKSQSINIGDQADRVLKLVEWTTYTTYGHDSYGNLKGNNVSWDAEYFDGKITEVKQCYYQQYLVDLKFTASFCKYYIMEQNKLDRIYTVYEDISLKDLLSSYQDLYGKMTIGDYFFSDDFEYYSILYLNNSGQATSEFKKIKQNSLPKDIVDSIQKRIQLREQKKLEELDFCQSLRKNTIILSEYDSVIYMNSFNGIIDKIKSHLHIELISSNELSTSYSKLCTNQIKNYRFKNTYIVSYYQHNTSSSYISGIENFSSDSTSKQVYTSLIEGNDSSCALFRKLDLQVPKIQVQGCEVLSRAVFPPITIDYTRGKTVITINEKGIKFGYKKPDLDIQNILQKEIGKRPFGRYTLEYVVILLNDVEIIKTILYTY